MHKFYTKYLYIHFLLICIPFLHHAALAEKISLEEDITDGYLDSYTKIEAAFILSGITNPDSLRDHLEWYQQLLAKINTFAFDLDDPIGSAQTVFMYLHAEWLITYALESTTLADIVRNKEYNCVSATILFNILCEDLNWSCEAFETPTHVYTILNNFRQKVMIENTSHMGFDIMKNLKAYSKYLAQYYPNNEVLRIGLDKLYYYENSKGRVINNTELLGLLAYNRAYLAKKKKAYKKAYEYVLLAQQFNRDSRSNVNFEIGLYYTWGNQLYNRQQYLEAFAVFADGYYRYPENEDFLTNTFSTFYKSLQINWKKKNWLSTKSLIEEMSILNIMKERDFNNLRQLLDNWLKYFNYKNDGESTARVKQLLEDIEDL
jgi:hypothetical protein